MKKVIKKPTKKVAAAPKKRVIRHVHATPARTQSKSFWGNDQNMIMILAAGTIILLVAGMFMAGWL